MKRILTTLIALGILTGCNGNQQAENEQNAGDTTRQGWKITAVDTRVPQGFSDQLAQIYTQYLGIKESLVASNARAALDPVKKMKVLVEETTGTGLEDEQAEVWAQHRREMLDALEDMDTRSIDRQREAFSALSGTLYQAVKVFGAGENPVYRQYCPMAFNDEGAYWLSDEQKIINPYFGERMLHCGSIREEVTRMD